MNYEMSNLQEQKRTNSEQKRWEELYRKYSEYDNEKERIKREKGKLGFGDLQKLNQIISKEEIDELKNLSKKTNENEDPTIRTFAEEIELKEIREKEFHSGEGIIELSEDEKLRKAELMEKSSFYFSKDNILKQVENMEDWDSV
ncbi:MAG: hypothetical protein P1P85_01150 [Patescibacteria group bacterium]|nr:hypothetical protein [Patescibacteria group bacterium]